MERQMIAYLPHILRDYREMKGIMDGQQWLFSQLWAAAEQVFLNQFMETADAAGLARWEGILHLTPKAGESLEERRFRVKTKWNQGQLPYTYRTLQQYLGTVSEDFEITLDAGDYILFLRIRLEGYAQRAELMATLRKMIPANIALEVQAEIPQEVEKMQLTLAALARTTVRHQHKGVYLREGAPSETLRFAAAMKMHTAVEHKYKGA